MTSTIDIIVHGRPGRASANFGGLQACLQEATCNDTLGHKTATVTSASVGAPSKFMTTGAFPALQGIADGKSFALGRKKPADFQPNFTGE
ncbi:hypothetical protein [Roseovarius arcticus]|uniref:hypothetical protein n=1 Tax=Roseovarius arcticus TaxID=2547404 RepID=UPI001110093E|nr:hypothetical protein [Roseovarius arcticus]